MMGQQTPPDIQTILAQVELEIQDIRRAGGTGTVIVYVGDNQLQLESNIKRKQEPVLAESARVAYIKRIRS